MTVTTTSRFSFGDHPIQTAEVVRTWDDEAELELVCSAIHRVSDEVSTFSFVSAAGSVFRFDPGQYCTIVLEIDGIEHSRCYTISSPPTRPYVLTISVKREAGGIVSPWLHDTLSVGDTLRVQGPFGSFSLGARPAAKYLFLAAGVGITPAMSMIRTTQDLDGVCDSVLIHSVRTPDHALFSPELDHFERRSSHFRRWVTVEDPGGAAAAPHLFAGRLTAEVLRAAAPDLLDRQVMVCGPQPYMDAARALLLELGVSSDDIHSESFSFESLVAGSEADPASPQGTGDADQPGSAFAVEFATTGQVVTVEPGEFILAAAQRQGMRLASSCSQGMCGTCKTQMLSGSVDMTHQGGIRPKEVANHKILLCCSTPLEDLVLEA